MVTSSSGDDDGESSDDPSESSGHEDVQVDASAKEDQLTRQDPGNTVEAGEEDLEGRIIRKPSRPSLPLPRKRQSSEPLTPTSIKKRLARDPKNVLPLPVRSKSPSTALAKTSVGVQTDDPVDMVKKVLNVEVQTDPILCKRSRRTTTEDSSCRTGKKHCLLCFWM